MKKYKNVGKTVAFIINGKQLDWENGQIVEVPDSFKEDVESALSKLEEVTTKQITPIAPEPAKPKYTAAALKKLNKSKQVEILKGLGVSKIPKLEKDRIDKILELSK